MTSTDNQQCQQVSDTAHNIWNQKINAAPGGDQTETECNKYTFDITAIVALDVSTPADEATARAILSEYEGIEPDHNGDEIETHNGATGRVRIGELSYRTTLALVHAYADNGHGAELPVSRNINDGKLLCADVEGTQMAQALADFDSAPNSSVAARKLAEAVRAVLEFDTE